MPFHSALYRGRLMHARHDEVARRAFDYDVYMAALDLDELPALDRSLALFSHRRWNVFSFDERHYAAAVSPSTRPATRISADSLRDSLADLRAANGLPAPAATRLVTNLAVVGYVFNPVSFFIDYDATGDICAVIAEVNNTYGGSLRYVLGPRDRMDSRRVGFRHVRELFVSPFLHGALVYEFWFDAPLDGRELAIEMHVTRADERGSRVFTARFGGRRAELSDRALAAAALRYPFMTVQVIGLIHLQALKLRLAGATYHRPGRDHRPRTREI